MFSVFFLVFLVFLGLRHSRGPPLSALSFPSGRRFSSSWGSLRRRCRTAGWPPPSMRPSSGCAPPPARNPPGTRRTVGGRGLLCIGPTPAFRWDGLERQFVRFFDFFCENMKVPRVCNATQGRLVRQNIVTTSRAINRMPCCASHIQQRSNRMCASISAHLVLLFFSRGL